MNPGAGHDMKFVDRLKMELPQGPTTVRRHRATVDQRRHAPPNQDRQPGLHCDPPAHVIHPDAISATSARNEDLVRGVVPNGGLWRGLRLITVCLPPLLVGVTMWTCWKGWFSPVDLMLFAVFYVISALGITVGFHRHFTHQSFRTKRWISWILGVMGSMALQGPLIWWVSTHRAHHQHADDTKDPHSPHIDDARGLWGRLRGFVHAHIGWTFKANLQDMSVHAKDLLADPLCRQIHAWFPFWVIMGLLLPALIGGVIAGSWWGAASGFLWGGAVRLFMVHHVTWSVNSVCHLWGFRDYESPDQSRNNPVVGVLAMGEGWHNNHHAFPYSARHGLEWWQFDPSWFLIRGLAAFGLATHLRTVPAERRRALRRRTLD